jgi:hypothetical protein
VAQILRFILPADEAAFDHEATRVMGEAFDNACAELQNSNLSDLARATIAGRIIAAAKRGERDPKRLCNVAVFAIRGEQKIV